MKNTEISELLDAVYSALKEKGYDPVPQLTGYILQGDPLFITGHNNARSIIQKFERDELLIELLNSYFGL